MFLLISGSSGAGKTTVGPLVADRAENLVFHDADERFGDPLEVWVETALGYQEGGLDMVLSTSRPFGELLACPDAIRLDAIVGCLLDCDDLTRAERLRARPHPRNLTLSQDILCWASWHRMHADDPSWCQHTIVDESERQWRRWTEWKRGDPRWHIPAFDTSSPTPDETAKAVTAWLREARQDPPLRAAAGWWGP